LSIGAKDSLVWRALLIVIFALSGCLAPPPPSRSELAQADRLLVTGITDFLENRPLSALETLTTSYPRTHQAELARQILGWKQAHPETVSPLATKKSVSDSELHELRDENQRLRSDIEKLRRILIDSERRTP